MSKWAILLSKEHGVQALAVTGEDSPDIKRREQLDDFVKWIDIAESTDKDKDLTENEKWQRVMQLEEDYNLINYCYGGVAVLATSEEREKYERRKEEK